MLSVMTRKEKTVMPSCSAMAVTWLCIRVRVSAACLTMMLNGGSDCYGVPYIPEGQWLCRKCTVSPENPVVSFVLSAFIDSGVDLTYSPVYYAPTKAEHSSKQSWEIGFIFYVQFGFPRHALPMTFSWSQ